MSAEDRWLWAYIIGFIVVVVLLTVMMGGSFDPACDDVRPRGC